MTPSPDLGYNSRFFSLGIAVGFPSQGWFSHQKKNLFPQKDPKIPFFFWPGVEEFRWKKQNRERIHGKFSGNEGKLRGFGDPKPHFLNFPWNSLWEVAPAPPSPFSPGLCPLGVGILPLLSLKIFFFGINPGVLPELLFLGFGLIFLGFGLCPKALN